jgi:hypothetical protein
MYIINIINISMNIINLHQYHQYSSISINQWIFCSIDVPKNMVFAGFGYHQWKKCPSQTQQTLLSPDPAGSITTSGGRGSCWGQQRPLSTRDTHD